MACTGCYRRIVGTRHAEGTRLMECTPARLQVTRLPFAEVSEQAAERGSGRGEAIVVTGRGLVEGTGPKALEE